MSTATAKLITAEEFFRMPTPPDGSLQELVRGKVETMPPPSTYHGVCCMEVGFRVRLFLREHPLGWVASNDSGFITERDPDTVRGPDLSFWTRDRLAQLPTEGYVAVVPDLVVEVPSPHDFFARFQRKLLHYLHHKVRLIWVLMPEDRSVGVYRPGCDPTLLSDADELSGGDVLPGFRSRVGELFP